MPANPVKVECLNPHTGRKINMDAEIYELFSKAIYHTLKKLQVTKDREKGITYTEIVNGIKKCFKEKKTNFKGSIEWYAV